MLKLKSPILPLLILFASLAFFPSRASSPLDGARWIGAPADSLPLYSPYLSVFRIDCDVNVADGEKIALFYGMNDPRLMDSNSNIFNLQNPADSSWIKVEVDSRGSIALFRSGYHPSDHPSVPLAQFPVSLKPGSNSLSVRSNFGHTDIFLNGDHVGYFGINPNGNGGDYLAFPVLAVMKLDIPDGCSVSDLKIRNLREPSSVLHSESSVFSSSTPNFLPVRSMPRLRSQFVVDSLNVANATLTASARGIYDVYLNGSRVNDEYFLPGSTQYNVSHMYHSFDLTDKLLPGENEIEVVLGEGWWSGPATYSGENWNFFGDRQSFISSLQVDYADGSSVCILSHPDSWQCCVDGPLVVGSFFNGEIFDNSPRSHHWFPAVEVPLDSSTVASSVGSWSDVSLIPSFGDRVLPFDTLCAVSLSEPRPGVFVYDFGQNMAAVPSISFSRLAPGQSVAMRYAEMLYPDMPQFESLAGMLMTENLRAAISRDLFIARGDSSEIFSPRFTLHGFRFLEITGIDSPLPLSSVRALRLSSVHDIKAHYECSDSLVNRLWQNICRSTLSNFISIPTDCPQRNERMGWMGDISVFAPTATLIADVDPLLNQFLQSVRDCQSPDGRFPDVAPTATGFGGILWGSAGITVPWALYGRYADLSALSLHFHSMQRYIDYILSSTLDPSSGLIVQNRAWADLGDWLSPEYDRNDKSLLWECYFIHDLAIMSDVSRILSRPDLAAHYDSLRSSRIDLFKSVYIDPATSRTRFSSFDPSREGRLFDTQASYALPIAMGIVTDSLFINNLIATVERSNVSDSGVACPPYSLMTGFIGTAWISEALSRAGRPDVAYRLLASTSYPSWLYPVTQGATTIWERLDSYTHSRAFNNNNNMNSFNHYSFGSVGRWLIERSLGINVDPDGQVIISPQPDVAGGSISWVSGWLDTPRGRISSKWEVKGDSVVFTISLPPDLPATFSVPGYSRPLNPAATTTFSLLASKL